MLHLLFFLHPVPDNAFFFTQLVAEIIICLVGFIQVFLFFFFIPQQVKQSLFELM